MEVVSNAKKQKEQERMQRINKILFIPIMVILTIVPLIVRMVEVDSTTDIVTAAIYGGKSYDAFSKVKSTVLLLFTIIMLVMLFLFFEKKQLKRDKWMKLYRICAGVFLGFTVLATLFSSARTLAIWGAPDRSEGMVVIGCYLIAMLYTIYSFRSYQNFNYIIIGLSIVLAVNTFLGIFQYIGKDLYTSELGKLLVLPKEMRANNLELTGVYEKGNMYGTMFHYNYIGSFTAMLVPLFMTLTMLLQGKKQKVIFGALTALSIVLLIGSTSRSGLVGVAGAFLIGLIVLIPYFVKRWKITVPLFVVAIVLVVVANAVAGNVIFKRVPTLISDISNLTKKQEVTDYKNNIYVKDIQFKGNTASFVLQNDVLTLTVDNGTVTATNAQGEKIDFTQQADKSYITDNANCNQISYKIEPLSQKDASGNSAGVCVPVIYHNNALVYIKAVQGQELTAMDYITEQPIEIKDAPAIGFKGKERVGSARGYIWSRTFPMLKDTILIGKGPDTFAAYFPNNDLYAKLWAYDFNATVDKPHDLYLQIAVNEGCVALAAFLVLVGAYMVQGFKLYGFKKKYERREAMGLAVMVAIAGYLTAGIFNDSVISVAPIFWVLLGVGISLNYLNSQENVQERKNAPHAVLNMKGKTVNK